MATIGVIADRETATYFKITGICNSYPADNVKEARGKTNRTTSESGDINNIHHRGGKRMAETYPH